MTRTAQTSSLRTWMTVTDAAEYAALSRDTIYNACLSGDLKHARVGGRRAIRLKTEWIDQWMERHSREAQSDSLFDIQ